MRPDGSQAYMVTAPYVLGPGNSVQRSVERRILYHMPLVAGAKPVLIVRIYHTIVKREHDSSFKDTMVNVNEKVLDAIALPIGETFEAIYELIDTVNEQIDAASGITYLLHADTGILGETSSCEGYYVTFAGKSSDDYIKYIENVRWEANSRVLVACDEDDCDRIEGISYAVLRITFSDRHYYDTSAAVASRTYWGHWLREALGVAKKMHEHGDEDDVQSSVDRAMILAGEVGDYHLRNDSFVLEQERERILEDVKACILHKEKSALKRIRGDRGDPTCHFSGGGKV